MSPLTVWLGAEVIGRLDRAALEFSYTEAIRAQLGRAPVLSVSMPVRNRAYTGDVPAAFFEGLLPEGEARRMIAYDLRVDVNDTFDLLSVIGRDCAGAVCLLPEGELPDTTVAAAPVTEADLARRLRDLPVNPLGVDQEIRVSLAGLQAKLLVSQSATGAWALPAGSPSTHILKPESPVWESSVDNEFFCMEVARSLGLPVAEVGVAEFEDVRVLVVTRYDRAVVGGQIRRVHQEDFAQALGLAPSRKYESGGGASMADCARILERWSARGEDVMGLLDVLVVSTALGNADLHSKNLSLRHGPDHSVGLAPIYDLMSTTYCGRTTQEPAMAVNGRLVLSEVRASDLIEEAVSWGLSRRRATERVGALAERLPAAIEAAAVAAEAPEGLVKFVVGNTRRLSEGLAVSAGPRLASASPESSPAGVDVPAGAVSVQSYSRADGSRVRAHPRRRPGPRRGQ